MASVSKTITCSVLLWAADDLTDKQLAEVLGRDPKPTLDDDAQIEWILDAFRDRLKQEAKSSKGFVVVGYDS